MKKKHSRVFDNFYTDNFNRALFDYYSYELSYYNPVVLDYDENNFGSWAIEFSQSRLIYDGKDNILEFQIRKAIGWCELKHYSKDQLSNDILEKVLKSIISKNDTHYIGLFNKKTLKFGGFFFLFTFLITTIPAHFYGLPLGRYPGGSPYDLSWSELYANLPMFIEISLIMAVLVMVMYNESKAKEDKDLYYARKRIKEREEKEKADSSSVEQCLDVDN
jgi:hypothetical protein